MTTRADPPTDSVALRDRTIRDFGDQWTRYRSNEGHYASLELFQDILGPFAAELSLEGAHVADIGSGTGRIVRMLAAAGAARIVAVEPSEAFDVLVDNTRDIADRVTYVRGPGEALPNVADLDACISFGVLHHIPDPRPVVRRCLEVLRPGGKMVAWLYGREGNEAYLAIATPLRAVTKRLPHAALAGLVWGLWVPLEAYAWLCRRAPLPMAKYLREHYGRLSPDVRRLTIYDQLNPSYAKYYTRPEAEALLRDAGFVDVRAYHRHGYSWTIIGTKAAS